MPPANPRTMPARRPLGRAILDEIIPPPPPTWKTSPVAFGEMVGDGSWQSYRHIEVMEQAFLDAIDPVKNPQGGRLIITVSVRHGKSFFGSRIFPAWSICNNPDKRVMLVGHSQEFADGHGRAARDYVTGYGHKFGVQVSQRSSAAGRWDIQGRDGGFFALGVGGSPIGRGADILLVDDPYRSFTDAMSARVRKEVRSFIAGSLFSRVQTGGTIILIMARWHPDDLVGYLHATMPGVWTELRMPAICDDPDNDPMGRALGDPLWPEEWPLEALEQRHQEVTIEEGEVVWDAQYQQTPTAAEGDFFDEEKWGYLDVIPVSQIKRWVRAWDLAATKNGGDWTVGVLMGELPNKGGWVIKDIERGRWDSFERDQKILRCARNDPRGTTIFIPQDPGQAGVDQRKNLAQMLRGYVVRSKRVSGAKEVRAQGVSSQQLNGNLYLPAAESIAWKGPLIAETNAFANGTHDDIVDALADAFHVLAGNRARVLV